MQNRSKHNAFREAQDSAKPARPLVPLHRRLLRLYPVAAVFSVIGEILAAFAALAILGLVFLLTRSTEKGFYYEFLLEEAEAAINYALPTYTTKLGSVELEGNSKRTGVFVVRDIDIQEKNGDDLIKVDEFRFTPEAPYKMLDGVQFTEFAFRNAEIEFTLAPKPGSERTSAETVIETIAKRLIDDIPFLTDDGKFILLNSSVILKSPNGDPFFEAPNISARLMGTDGQYAVSIITSSNEDRSDSFRANIFRKGDAISIDGISESYAIAELDGALFTGEWESSFIVTEGKFRSINDIRGRFALDGAGYAGEITGEFDEDAREFDVENFTMNFGQYSASGAGTIHEAKPYIVEFQFRDMNYPGAAALPESNAEGEDEASADGLVTFPEGGIAMRVDLENDRIDVGNLWVQNDKTRIDGHGYFRAAGGLFGSLDLSASDSNLVDLVSLWPNDVAKDAYKLATDTLKQGRLENTTLSLRAQTANGEQEFDYEMKGEINDLALKVNDRLPVLNEVDGSFLLNNGRLYATTQDGRLQPQNATGAVTIDSATLFINDFSKDIPVGDVSITAKAAARDFVSLISTPPLRFAQATKTNPNDYKGELTITLDGNLPLKSGLTLADADFQAKASIRNFETIFAGRRIQSPILEINGDETGVVIDQPFIFEGSTINTIVEQKIGAPAKIEFAGDLERQTLTKLGVNLPKNIRGERFPFRATQVRTERGNAFDVELDLTPVQIDAPAILWAKPAGETGRVNARFYSQNGVTDVENLSIQLRDVTGRGQARGQKGRLEIRLDDLNFANIYSGAVTYVSGQPAELRVNGERLNVQNIKLRPAQSNGSNNSTEIIGKVARVQLTDKVFANNVEASLIAQNGVVGSVYGDVGGKTRASVELSRQNGQARFVLLSNDAGGFLRDIDAFGEFRGGDLRAELRATGAPQSFRGNAIITDTRLEDSRIGIQLLQAASIVGLLDIANNEGIYFSEISGEIDITPSTIAISKGKAVGPTIGLSVNGNYDRRGRYLDMSGVLTPAYLFNGFVQQIPVIGRVIGGKEGEGVIGMSYELYGPLGNTTVTADPLSLFTPGVLREIWGEIKAGIGATTQGQGDTNGRSSGGSSGSGSAGSAGSLPGSLPGSLF